MYKKIFMCTILIGQFFASCNLIKTEISDEADKIISALKIHKNLEYILNLDLDEDKDYEIKGFDKTLLKEMQTNPSSKEFFTKYYENFKKTVHFLQENRDRLDDLQTYFDMPGDINLHEVTLYAPQNTARLKYILKKASEPVVEAESTPTVVQTTEN